MAGETEHDLSTNRLIFMATYSRYPSITPQAATPVVPGADLGKTRTFLPSKSYVGSSAPGSPEKNFSGRQDYPAIQAGTGKLISGVTGLPWTGPDPRTSPTTDPNDPSRYQPLEVIKSPAVAAGANVLMDSFKQGAEATTKGWTDFFNEAKAAQAMNREAFQREQQAFNVAPFANDLRANNEAFATQSREIGGRYRDVDAEYEAAQRALTEKAYQTNNAEVEAAKVAVANRIASGALGNVSRYKAGSGTPTSLGSSEIAMTNRAIADSYLPYELDRVNRKMGLITNLEMPLEREYATRDAATLGNEYQSERYLSERNADTEKQIKQLELSVAGMSRAQAESYIRSLGLPMQIQQEILARHIANLGGIGQLEEQSRYRGLQDTQGVNLTPTVGYSMGTGTYPTIPQNVYRPSIPEYQPVYNPATSGPAAPGSTTYVPGESPYYDNPIYTPKVRDMLIRNYQNSKSAPATYQPIPYAPNPYA